jgi:hypothetical protein
MSLDDDDSYLWRSPADGAGSNATEPSPGAEPDKFAAFEDDVPAAAPRVEATRPASEAGARRRSAKSERAAKATQPGSLASKVLTLRILEDDVAALLGEVECALQALEAERTLEDAGFRSADDFRERIAGQMGLLHAMREPKRRAAQATGRVRKRSHARPRGGDMRARRTQALSAIEQAMARFRELGRVMRGKVEDARDLLAGIERDQTFVECGYASFDEFLELAIGPSPILTKCLTVLDGLPPAPEPEPEPEPAEASSSNEEELPSLADPPGPIVSDDRPPALFELPQEPASDAAPPDGAAADEAVVVPARQLKVQRSAIAVSIALGVISTVIGTLAGVRASHAAQSAAQAEPPAAMASPEETAEAPHRPGPPAPAEAKHGSVVQVASQSAASSGRRGHDETAAPKKDPVPSFIRP